MQKSLSMKKIITSLRDVMYIVYSREMSKEN